MKQYKIPLSSIKILMNELTSKYDVEGSDTKILKIINKDKKSVGTVEIMDNMEIKVTGQPLITRFNRFEKLVKEAEKNKLTSKEFNNSILNVNDNSNGRFTNLEENRTIFNEISKNLKDLNIGGVKFFQSLSHSTTVNTDKIILSCEGAPNSDVSKNTPNGYYDKLKEFLYKTYTKNYFDNPSSISNTCKKFLQEFKNETIVEIIIKEQLVGTYYPERNFISLHFNPFDLIRTNGIENNMPTLFTDLFDAFKELDIKKNDTSKLANSMFITEFLKKSKQAIVSTKRGIDDKIRSINDYESSIRCQIEDLSSLQRKYDYLQVTMNQDSGRLSSEIEMARKLPFIKEIKLGTDTITMAFNETFIPIPNLKQIDYDKGVGKRYVYGGHITFTISPDKFTLSNTEPFDDRAHPHASGNPGQPCFGDGEGRNNIYEMLAAMRFTDLAKLLWFWIKTYRDNGAYVHVGRVYNERLQNGYPVFDAKGTRININDADRIKKKEQITLNKTIKYDANIKKFKDIRLS